jgi:D-lactate dehydrogenase (cytochrome)
MSGSITDEHCVGQGRQKYLDAEFGSEAIETMRVWIGQAIDPSAARKIKGL